MNDVATQKTLDENVLNHLRDNFGKLMTDEQLTAIYERGITKLLESPAKVVTGNTFNQKVEYKDSPIIKLLKEIAQPMMEEQIAKVIKEHEKEILEEIQKLYGDPTAIVQAVLGGVTASFVSSIQNDLIWKVNNILSNNGVQL